MRGRTVCLVMGTLAASLAILSGAGAAGRSAQTGTATAVAPSGWITLPSGNTPLVRIRFLSVQQTGSVCTFDDIANSPHCVFQRSPSQQQYLVFTVQIHSVHWSINCAPANGFYCQGELQPILVVSTGSGGPSYGPLCVCGELDNTRVTIGNMTPGRTVTVRAAALIRSAAGASWKGPAVNSLKDVWLDLDPSGANPRFASLASLWPAGRMIAEPAVGQAPRIVSRAASKPSVTRPARPAHGQPSAQHRVGTGGRPRSVASRKGGSAAKKPGAESSGAGGRHAARAARHGHSLVSSHSKPAALRTPTRSPKRHASPSSRATQRSTFPLLDVILGVLGGVVLLFAGTRVLRSGVSRAPAGHSREPARQSREPARQSREPARQSRAAARPQPAVEVEFGKLTASLSAYGVQRPAKERAPAAQPAPPPSHVDKNAATGGATPMPTDHDNTPPRAPLDRVTELNLDDEDAGLTFKTQDVAANALARAQQSAARIREDAEKKAAEIEARAREAAKLRARELEERNVRIRKEAEEYAIDLRANAEAYASRVMRESDERARLAKVAHDAQAQARIDAAEEAQKRFEVGVERRKAELQSEIGVLEMRLDGLLRGLNAMVGQTSRILKPTSEVEDAEPSLLEAVDVQRHSAD